MLLNSSEKWIIITFHRHFSISILTYFRCTRIVLLEASNIIHQSVVVKFNVNCRIDIAEEIIRCFALFDELVYHTLLYIVKEYKQRTNFCPSSVLVLSRVLSLQPSLLHILISIFPPSNQKLTFSYYVLEDQTFVE